MALESQSDRVGFDEVYNRTRREHCEVNRRSTGHRCMWCFIGLDVVVSVYAARYFCFSWSVVSSCEGWFDVTVGKVIGVVSSVVPRRLRPGDPFQHHRVSSRTSPVAPQTWTGL